MMPPSTVPSGLPSEPMTITAKDVTVASTPMAGVIEPSMNGANTPPIAASAIPIANAIAETRCVSMPGNRFDHLRQAEEQNDRQHFRIFCRQQPRNENVVERHPDEHEQREREWDDCDRIDLAQRVEPEGEISAEHQKIAMRKIDDAHD